MIMKLKEKNFFLKKIKSFRTCVISQNKILKSQLYRLIFQQENLFIDVHQNLKGRACYVEGGLLVQLINNKKLIQKIFLSLKIKKNMEVKLDVFFDQIKEISKQKGIE